MYPISKSFKIERLENETDNRYSYRCWFIAKQNPTNITDFKDVVKWSIIDTYILYDKCEYPDNIMDIVKRMRINLD